MRKDYDGTVSAICVDDERMGLAVKSLAIAPYVIDGSVQRVEYATDPLTGFKIAEKLPNLGVAVLDYNMPEFTGLQLFNALRLSDPRIQGVIVTSNDDLGLKQEIERAGGMYLPKTAKPSELIGMIGEAIQAYHRAMEDDTAQLHYDTKYGPIVQALAEIRAENNRRLAQDGDLEEVVSEANLS
ncbi:MAG: response regulator [Candidatus Woesearchaeota archaeon]